MLHVSTAVGFRGGEQQALYLMKALQSRNIDQVLATPVGSMLEKHAMRLGIPHLSFSNRLQAVKRIRKWAKESRREGAQLLAHAHDSHAHTSLWLANLIPSISKADSLYVLPFVASRRVFRAPKPPTWSGGKYAQGALRGVLCVSEAVAELHRKSLGDQVPIRVVYSAVEQPKGDANIPENSIDLRELIGLPKATQLVGTVAALTPEKDTPTFVKTCSAIAKELPGVHFVHIGTGNDEQQEALRSLIAETGLQQRIHVLGFREDAVQLIGEFSVFLFTTQWEGLGSSILQAQIRGIPVVSTAIGGTTELVEDGVSGRTAPVGDWQVLAKAVIEILTYEVDYHRFSIAGTIKANEFSVERMAEKTLEVYRQAL